MAVLKSDPTLDDIQAYIAKMCEERGFHKENIAGKFMLLTEEVGEFAKATRKNAGIKVDGASHKHDIAEEAADVLWVLVDLCNTLGVKLKNALRQKEEKNKRREWK